MTDAYVRWSDVRIEEEITEIYGDISLITPPQSVWTAEFEGGVHPAAGDTSISEAVVSFSRSGPTAEEAVAALMMAAQAQGWVFV